MVALNVAVDTALDCVCVALEEALRPACACYPVVGPPMWRPCCECGEAGTSGNLRAFVENVYPVDGNTLLLTQRIESCRRGPWAVDIALSLTRCYPTLSENDLPEPPDEAEAARELHDDIDIIRGALTCCQELRVSWRSLGVEADPDAGCSEIIARITVGLN